MKINPIPKTKGVKLPADDPRRKAVAAAFKRLTDCAKVTSLKADGNRFTARCGESFYELEGFGEDSETPTNIITLPDGSQTFGVFTMGEGDV